MTGGQIDKRALLTPIADGDLLLEQMAEPHRVGLRAACAADHAIWAIYPTNWRDNFDACFDGVLNNAGRCPFTIHVDGEVVGMSGFLNFALDKQGLEIGNSYIRPDLRGSGLNTRVKHLLLTRAFGCGIRRVEFRIDERNARSQAAVAKLGAVKEGVLRAERVLWNGNVRDTGVFSILADEWATRKGA